MTMVREYTDRYNNNKIWVIKKTSCGHYYINQKICGKLYYPKYQRVTLDYIRNILALEDNVDI